MHLPNPKMYVPDPLCCSWCGARFVNGEPQCDCLERWYRGERVMFILALVYAAAMVAIAAVVSVIWTR